VTRFNFKKNQDSLGELHEPVALNTIASLSLAVMLAANSIGVARRKARLVGILGDCEFMLIMNIMISIFNYCCN
jgi:hypothetical protein